MATHDPKDHYPTAAQVVPVGGQQCLIHQCGDAYYLSTVESWKAGIRNSRQVTVEDGTWYDAHNVLLVPLPHQLGPTAADNQPDEPRPGAYQNASDSCGMLIGSLEVLDTEALSINVGTVRQYYNSINAAWRVAGAADKKTDIYRERERHTRNLPR